MYTQIPISIALVSFMFLFSLVNFICHIKGSLLLLCIAIILFCINIFIWIWNLGDEYTRIWHLTERIFFVKGFYIFIITEILFFFSFFWAYYSFSIDSIYIIGATWPPLSNLLFEIVPLHFSVVTVYMNICLLASSLLIALCSTSFNTNISMFFILSFILAYGYLFIYLHIFDYLDTELAIMDGIYASSLYVITGLHCIHVIIGVFFMIALLNKLDFINTIYFKITYKFNFVKNHIFILISFYYWHLVDMIWILVLITQYIHYNIQDITFLNDSTFIVDTITLYA